MTHMDGGKNEAKPIAVVVLVSERIIPLSLGLELKSFANHRVAIRDHVMRQVLQLLISGEETVRGFRNH